MTRQVAFSNEAYTALKREKRGNESFSTLVMRLMREARMRTKDVALFTTFQHRRAWPPAEHLRLLEGLRDADRAEPRHPSRAGHDGQEP